MSISVKILNCGTGDATILGCGSPEIVISECENECSTIGSHDYLFRAESGNFYSITNPNNYANSGDLVSAGVLSLNGLGGIVKLTGLGNVTVSTGAGGIILVSGSGNNNSSAGGSSLIWQNISGSLTGLPNYGYICNNTGVVSVTLPNSFTLGDTVKMVGRGSGVSGLWQVKQQNDQIIYFGNTNTSAGPGGYLMATYPKNCVELVQVVSGEWEVVSSMGNIEIY